MAYEAVTLDPGTGGADVAVDTVDGKELQIIKLDAGGDTLSVPIIAGRQADAASIPVALSSEVVALIDGLETAIASTNTKLDTVISSLSTIDGRVDGLETLITATNSKLDTENTNSGAAATSLGTLDNAISGSEVQVDVVAALPAGTNAIGKLAANSGVDIGDVDVTSISAGENHLGEVGGKTIVKSVTLSTDTAAYASGDLIADTQQIDAFFRKADGTGVIQTLTIIDEEAQGVAMYILFHLTSTSMGSENSAPNISDANASAGIQGMVAIAASDWVTVSGVKIACIRNIGLPVKAASGTDDLYISALNSTGAPDWDADSLVVQIGALLD